MSGSDLAQETLAILVQYQLPVAQSPAFQSLLHAAETTRGITVYLFDNSPVAASPAPTDAFEVIYHHAPVNTGVGAAYNEGHRIATRLGKRWMLLLDQDTALASNLFDIFASGIQHSPEEQLLVPLMEDGRGIVSPYRVRLGRGRRPRHLLPRRYAIGPYRIINSGMLVSVALFQQADGYDERYPLDFSDVVFCERLAPHHPHFTLIPARCRVSLSAEQDLPEALLTRFARYCAAARRYHSEHGGRLLLFWVLLPRVVRLIFQRRDLAALRIAFLHAR